MQGDDLSWRVEAACRHAWPALEEMTDGPWRLRFANGRSRRANSVNAIDSAAALSPGIIARAEAEYARRNLPAIFRVTGLQDPSIDRQLDAAGYVAEGDSRTLHADLPPMPMRRDPDVTITTRPDDAWFAAMARLQGWDDDILAGYAAIVTQIGVTRTEGHAAFFRLDLDGTPAALAFSVIHDGIACLESVVSDPARRRRGYAARLVGALLAWAIGEGAGGACLQVDADNAAAINLYRNMGFLRDLYPYRYRVKAS